MTIQLQVRMLQNIHLHLVYHHHHMLQLLLILYHHRLFHILMDLCYQLNLNSRSLFQQDKL